MTINCIGKFHRPPIFNCIARGLVQSNLNPFFFNKALAPLRFVAALVISACSPIFAACDLLIYLGASIAFSVDACWDWAWENLQDAGVLLVRWIPDAISFPFLFAYDGNRAKDLAHSVL